MRATGVGIIRDGLMFASLVTWLLAGTAISFVVQADWPARMRYCHLRAAQRQQGSWLSSLKRLEKLHRQHQKNSKWQANPALIHPSDMIGEALSEVATQVADLPSRPFQQTTKMRMKSHILRENPLRRDAGGRDLSILDRAGDVSN